VGKPNEMTSADSPETGIDASLSAEIDAGVETAMQDIEKERAELEGSGVEAEAEVKDKTEEPEEPAGGKNDETGDSEQTGPDGGDDPAPVSDDLVERAVKAGLTLSEARQYPNADLLAKVCDRLEATTRADDEGTDNEDDGAQATEPGVDDLLASIPDLNPDEYDEQIVAGFKAMKDLIRSQSGMIQELRGSQGVEWFDSQVNALGVSEVLKAAPEKRDALKRKFELLEAGYKATGQEVERDSVFREAADLVLKEELAQATDAATSEALEKRKGLHINRPSARRPKPKGDAFEEVASELDRKFFDKK